MGHHHGAGGAQKADADDGADRHPDRRVRPERQRREDGNDHLRAAHRDPFARVQYAVERTEGEHADLIRDDGDEQNIAGRDGAQAMHLAQEPDRPTGPAR